MDTHAEHEVAGASKTRRLERNEYFNGKLMTSRDMKTEQDYHRDRLHALSQHVLGSGLVCGLSTKVQTVDGRLKANVAPGYALDRVGRLIKVTDNGWVKVTPHDDSGGPSDKDDENGRYPDVISVYLTYDECFTEAVAVPDLTNGCEERCCYNRVVEQFALTYADGTAETKTVPPIAFPEQSDFGEYDVEKGVPNDDPHLLMMAREYYDEHLPDCDPHGEFSLFLGAFERPGDEDRREGTYDWKPVSPATENHRPFVYTNDMLYAAIARHATDYTNPHEVSINKVVGTDGNVDLETDSLDIDPDPGSEEVNINLTEKQQRTLAKCDKLAEKCDDLETKCDDLENDLKVLGRCVARIVESGVFDDYENKIECPDVVERYLQKQDLTQQKQDETDE